MSIVSRSSLNREYVKEQLRHLSGSDMVMLMFFSMTLSYIRTADSLGWFSDKQVEGRLRLIFPRLKINKSDFSKYKKMRQELIEILHPFVNLHIGLQLPIPVERRSELRSVKHDICLDVLLKYFDIPLSRKILNKGVRSRVYYYGVSNMVVEDFDKYLAICHIQRMNSMEDASELVNVRVGDIKRRSMARKGHPLFKDQRFTKIKHESEITLDLFREYKFVLYMDIKAYDTDPYKYFVNVKGEDPNDVLSIFHHEDSIDSVESLGEFLCNSNYISTGSPYIASNLGCKTWDNFTFNRNVFVTKELNFVNLKIPNTPKAATLWVDLFSTIDKEFSKFTRS